MKPKSLKPDEIGWDDIHGLLVRKLRLKQRERDEIVFSEIQRAYDGLRDAVRSAVQLPKTATKLVPDLLATYSRLVEIASDTTRTWPESVRVVITDLLTQMPTAEINRTGLNELAARYTWPSGEVSLPLQIVDARRFKELISRETSRFGISQENLFTVLDESLGRAAALANVAILNLTRRAAETLAVSIDEYLITWCNQASKSQASLQPRSSGIEAGPFSVFQEMKSLTFQEIKIRVDDDNLTLIVSARDINITTSFLEFGFTRKNGISLSVLGTLFMAMARQIYQPKKTPAQISALNRLSKLLRRRFGTKDSPFLKGTPQFRIFIPKDRAAEESARWRTNLYNDEQFTGDYNDLIASLPGNEPESDEDNEPEDYADNQAYLDDNY
jgi:hypothetical protein